MIVKEHASVYRFRDTVAFHTEGTNETIYIDAKMARQIAKAFVDCAKDIKQFKFSESEFKSKRITR